MAGISFPRLVDRFVGDLERQGATVFLEQRVRIRPARIRVDGRGYVLFLWTITPGGGPVGTRPANERRIQITNVTGFPLYPDSRTLVGGWSAESGAWAFWDARRHVRFSRASPSFQVDARTLERGFRDGLAVQVRPTREGHEVVVAVIPDSLLWYVRDGAPLHNATGEAGTVAGLIEAAPEDERAFLDADQSEAAIARRLDLVQTLRAFRESRFRPSVLRAYGYRCAVCGVALKLVDAAHIVPVAYPGSTDDVTNGLALCRLHHAAFDNALIGVFPDYRVVLHDAAADRLNAVNLGHGLDEFRAALPSQIRVPGAAEVRPRPEYLRIGLRARGWEAAV